MLRKLVLGLAALAALSTTALMPSAASAKGWKHHHHHGFHHHFHGHGHWGGGPRFVVGGGYGGCYVKRLVETPYGLRYRVVNVCY
ncbi:MAG: hypothetical protein V4661_10335 [Pseudomonadota bacterium]